MQWIKSALDQHAGETRNVASFGFRRLPQYYRTATLATTSVVVVPKLPVPPLSRFGLTQFKDWESTEYGGITYMDTFFVTPDFSGNESLYFHELIHVVQWRLLGAERFVIEYAHGLERFGYRDSPLEVMAYDAQERFDRGEVFDAEALVQQAVG